MLSVVSLLAVASTVSAAEWSASNFKNLITFGDSYTDENRLNYFGSHNGSAPPAGTFLPESFSTASGGRIWDRYVIQYTGQSSANGTWEPSMTLYDYAVSGAVCSNEITPRFFSTINAPFPSIAEYELPAFLADKTSDRNETDEPYFEPALTADDSVYAMWIGTNDIGVWAFLTDSQIAGMTLTDYTDCVYAQLDRLYTSGARNFVLINLAPLDLAPLYANASQGGVGPNTSYWPDKPSNITAISEVMKEYTSTLNTVYQYQTGYEVLAANRYPGANFALFDVHSLITDIYTNPTAYLNGSAPANVTGYNHHCNINGTDCTSSDSPDSFLWYDALHPSEQTDRIIAMNFVDILNGNSTYATYFTSPTTANSTQMVR